MAVPTFTMRQLLEAGVHFGHSTRRWNPKMAPYLFGVRNGIHIIDLQQTVPMLYEAMKAVRDTVAAGGRVLFVGTKRQAADRVADAAGRCGQYFVNHRWLGGMMTNWNTISNSIKRLRDVERQISEETLGLTKKELLRLTRERDKLERALGGIKEMGGLPDVLIIIDTNKEAIAVAEARKLGIPVVAVVDSNSNPNGINFPVPGNDDAIRAINLYCDLFVATVLDGIQAEMSAAGVDVGEQEALPEESLTPAEGSDAVEGAEIVAVADAAPAETTAEAKAEPAEAVPAPAATAGPAAETPAPEAEPAVEAPAPEAAPAETPAPEAAPAETPAPEAEPAAETPAPEAAPAETPAPEAAPAETPTEATAEPPAFEPAEAGAEPAKPA